MRSVLIFTTPIHLLFVPGWCHGAVNGVPLISAIQLKEQIPKEQIMDARVFFKCRSVRVLLVAVVLCLWMSDTIVVFGVWACNTLKMHSCMTHLPVVGV